MPSFSAKSRAHLAGVHPELRELFERVVLQFDCTVLDGARTLEEQHANVAKGVSKTMDSKHLPQADGWAYAVDVVPFPVDWNNKLRMALFAGYVLGIAESLGLDVRWGGDWNGNRNPSDESFQDMPHFELRRRVD